MAQPAGSLANWRALSEQLGPQCMRIASYNVHGCVGADGGRDPGRVADVILETGCDTIGVQEVHQAEVLAARTGFDLVEGARHTWHDRHVGNALLTRRKVLGVRHHEYGWTGCEPRSALDVELEVDGDPVRVIVTHLGLKPVERRYQVGKILELVKHSPLDRRVLVLGDINEWLPLGRPLRWMHALLGHSPSERSFPSRWPLFALDRVWVRPRNALLVFGAHRSPLARLASDHLPVKAIVAAHEKRNGPARGPSRVGLVEA